MGRGIMIGGFTFRLTPLGQTPILCGPHAPQVRGGGPIFSRVLGADKGGLRFANDMIGPVGSNNNVLSNQNTTYQQHLNPSVVNTSPLFVRPRVLGKVQRVEQGVELVAERLLVPAGLRDLSARLLGRTPKRGLRKEGPNNSLHMMRTQPQNQTNG